MVKLHHSRADEVGKEMDYQEEYLSSVAYPNNALTEVLLNTDCQQDYCSSEIINKYNEKKEININETIMLRKQKKNKTLININ